MKNENYEVISKEEALAKWWDKHIYLREKETGDIYRLKIEQDDMPLNPREDYDGNLCTIFSQKGNWDIGDPGYSYARDEAPEKYKEFKKRQDKGEIFMLPIYMYDHSGQTISLRDFQDRWDSGICGFAFVEKEKLFKEWPDTTEDNWKEKAYQVIQDEIETYDKYIKGEAYAWLLEKTEIVEHTRKSDGRTWTTIEWEVAEAIGGYLGDPEESNLIDDAVGDRFEYIEEVKD